MKLPEQVRAQQCTHAKCQECGTKDNCFQSVNWGSAFHKKYTGQVHPMSTLLVRPGLPFTSYRASFYANCDAGRVAKIEFRTKAMNNGILKIFMNDIYEKTLTKDYSAWKPSKKNTWFQTHKGSDGEAFQLSVEFFPSNPKAASSVTLEARLFNIQPKFEQCMDRTNCLNLMGNMTSKASYALRNKNAYQLSCLRRATTLPSFLEDTCEAWRSCVEKNPPLAKYLLTSLSAANPSMLQVEATVAATQDECLDPAIADAEALECECMVWLHEKCGDDEECFKSKYCEDNRVCGDWKVANGCPQLLLQAESNSSKGVLTQSILHKEISSSANILSDDVESASYVDKAMLTRQKGQEDADLSGSLDGSLEGKCTSETQ